MFVSVVVKIMHNELSAAQRVSLIKVQWRSKELGNDGETVPSICSYVDVCNAEVGNKTLSAIRGFSFSSYST